jgi:hypothetical protein
MLITKGFESRVGAIPLPLARAATSSAGKSSRHIFYGLYFLGYEVDEDLP